MPELIYNMPEEEYHNHPALSKSKLSDFMVSPYNFQQKHILKTSADQPDNEAFRVGRLVHKMVLEGEDAFYDTYASPAPSDLKKPTAAQMNAKKPSDDTLKQIEAWNEYEQSIGGKEPLKATDLILVRNISVGLKNHSEAAKALQAIKDVEVSAFFNYRGFDMRSRFDALTETGIIDLKTMAQAPSERTIRYAVRDYSYDIQAALYSAAYKLCTGKHPSGFTFVFVQKTYPNNVGLARLSAPELQKATTRLDQTLDRLAHCIETDTWPGTAGDELIILENL